jgi:hypothetical protein
MRVREIVRVDGDKQGLLGEYFARYEAWQFLAPTCTTEVVTGSEGTGLHFDRPVPGEILKRLTYQPRRGARPVKHVSEDGRLIYPLTTWCAIRVGACWPDGLSCLGYRSAARSETMPATAR